MNFIKRLFIRINITNILCKQTTSFNTFVKNYSLIKPLFIQRACASLKPAFFTLASFSAALQLVNSKVSVYDVEENIIHLMTLARIALEEQDPDNAEAILDMGIQISNEYKVYFALYYMYDILTSIALAKGELEKAEQLLVNAIEKLVQIGTSEKDNQIVDFKLRLSRLYSSIREDDFAEIGFKDCIYTQKSKIVDGDTGRATGMLYVSCLFWYGLHRIKMAEYMEARRLIRKAYEYSTKIENLNPQQEMIILYTMANLNFELEEYDLALQNIQNAIILAKGIDSVDLSRCYVKLAKIYLKLTSWENAEKFAVEGSKLARVFRDYDLIQEADEILNEVRGKSKQ